MNSETERPNFPMRADRDRHTGRADDGKKISGARKEGEEIERGSRERRKWQQKASSPIIMQQSERRLLYQSLAEICQEKVIRHRNLRVRVERTSRLLAVYCMRTRIHDCGNQRNGAKEGEGTEGWVTATPVQVTRARLEFGAMAVAQYCWLPWQPMHKDTETSYSGINTQTRKCVVGMLPTKGGYGCSNEDGDDGDDAVRRSLSLFLWSFLFIRAHPSLLSSSRSPLASLRLLSGCTH